MAEDEGVRMQWCLHQVMAGRGIRTATELHRMLRDVGVHITSAHLSTFVSGAPRRVSHELMYGLTLVLECTAGDLWKNPDAPKRKRRRKNRSKKTAGKTAPSSKTYVSQELVTGPAVRPFSAPKNSAEKT